ncbi:MAG TPA: GNAT family protein [Prolixibacteraceae bacterium]|jgi:RimJ/RimL family protein N-acetyltransferase
MLTGKNISLRSLRISDADFLNKWRNNLENKIMSQGYRLPISLPKDEEWLKSKMLSSNNTEVYFIVEESGLPIGLIQLTNIDYISGTATWGFILGDKNSRGKGYSVEAPLLLFNYAFNILNLRKIIGYPLDLNIATLRMHQKIGNVREEGCLKSHYFFNNKYWDVHILSFFKEDFNNLSFEL